MKKPINNAAGVRRDPPPALHCNVVVEPTAIDFLNLDAVLVAGSGGDCGCGISPVPQPRKSNRRRDAGNGR